MSPRKKLPCRLIRRWLATYLMVDQRADDPRLAGLRPIAISEIPRREMDFGAAVVRKLTDAEVEAVILKAWDGLR